MVQSNNINQIMVISHEAHDRSNSEDHGKRGAEGGGQRREIFVRVHQWTEVVSIGMTTTKIQRISTILSEFLSQ